MQNLTGQTIKGLELREIIGSGGFGVVYRAHQPLLNREVAIKIILPEHANQPDFIRSFESEAQIIARLEHPYIVPLYDYWRDPDGAYLVMRFIRGGSLRSLINSRILTTEEIAVFLTQITSALHIAHRANIVHRDLKPENILVDADGNAYLTDFGIARPVGQQSNEEDISGTLEYVSPEELQSQPCTPQADIYSLGVMLLELLVGRHPYRGLGAVEMLLKHLNEPLPSLRDLRPDLPASLEHVIMTATAKKPADRYASVRDLAVEFRKAASPGKSLDSVTSTHEILVSDAPNPYKGLRAFQEADAPDFFGRDELVRRLLNRLTPQPGRTRALSGVLTEDAEVSAEGRFLAVIGPSGSGKSSTVMAGLMPALRRGELPGSHRWFIVSMTPGRDPLRNLEAALLSVATRPPAHLAQQLRADPQGLLVAVERILLDAHGHTRDEGDDLLLLIDQFEEVFTMLEDPAERARFLDLLRVGVTTPQSRLRIVITMRADFTDRPLSYPDFGELVRQNVEFVMPMNAGELEKAIAGPARRVGVSVRPDLIAAVISDVRDEPGALPLLQYALTETFEGREDNRMTLAAYRASGGVIGALARRADEIYAGLNQRDQALTRQIFLRLVTLGEGSNDTRRRVLRSELTALGEVNPLIDMFGRVRLLTFDQERGTREPLIEVAHEALITQWRTLRRWLDESRSDIRLQRQLAVAAEEWRNHDQDISYLLRGARLEMFEGWEQSTLIALTQDERHYLRVSIQQRAAEAASETARRKREEQLIIRDEQRKVELDAATQRFQEAERAAIEAEQAAIRTGERAIQAEGRARTAQRSASLAALVALVIGIAAIAATFILIGVRDAAEAGRATAEFEALLINNQVARIETLIPGVGVPPTSAAAPSPFLLTATAIASLADWEPVIVADAGGVPMVEVPPGCYVMGNSYNPDESPPHEICITAPFYLDQYEVSNSQFAQLGGVAANIPYPGSDDSSLVPRVNLTWREAYDFCVNQRGGRLPTEAEWEYAARGPNSLPYTYGVERKALSEIYGDSFNQLQPIGSGQGETSWVGAVDLLANAQEWTSSLLASYPYNATDGREDVNATGSRVTRGASYFLTTADRAADRSQGAPDSPTYDIGFRCAASIQ